MDPNALGGMVFTLVLAAMIGGFILLAPLTRRLGVLLEQKVQDKNPRPESDDVRQLRERVQSLEQEVRYLNERQHFTDQLLASGQERALMSRGGTERGD